METTREMVFWADHSDLANHSHYVIALWFVYHPGMYKSTIPRYDSVTKLQPTIVISSQRSSMFVLLNNMVRDGLHIIVSPADVHDTAMCNGLFYLVMQCSHQWRGPGST